MSKIKIASLIVLLAVLGGLLFVGIRPAKAHEIDPEEDCRIETLEVTKTNDPVGEVAPGTEILYTITVKNISLEETGPVVIRDHWKFIGDETATYVEGSASGNADVWEADQKIIWQVANIDPGEEVSFTYKLQADPTNEHLGTFTIINRVCAEVAEGDPCARVKNTVTYTPAPTPTPTPTVIQGSGGGTKVKKVLGTSTTPAVSATPESLPVTGADVDYTFLYALGLFGFSGLIYWKRLTSLKAR